jgi:hypothetical protein
MGVERLHDLLPLVGQKSLEQLAIDEAGVVSATHGYARRRELKLVVGCREHRVWGMGFEIQKGL